MKKLQEALNNSRP